VAFSGRRATIGVASAVVALSTFAPFAEAQESVPPPAVKLPWNEWALPGIDLQLHVTAMVDGAFFAQNAANVEQVGALGPEALFRLDNLEVDGQLKWPIPWSFQIAVEYDGADQGNSQRGWTLSDLNLTLPIAAHTFVTVGNQSQGVSMERLANSYDLAFMERSAPMSALTVARSTGVRLKGTLAGERMNWSAGWYNGWLTNDLSFSESGNIVNARIAGLPIDARGGRRLLHLGGWGAWTEAQEGAAQSRARPEVYEAPFFADTGSFPAEESVDVGFEFAAVEGPVTLSAEYMGSRVSSTETGDPRFSGYYVEASWAITGETRPYGRLCGCFGELEPSAPLSLRNGRLGALEIAGRYSHLDLESRAVGGGVFDRWSGALSWFPTNEFRFEFNYGYGTLQKSGLSGKTHFYQLRLQWEI
jgi:phosphate-selective porin OprO/OprP